MTIFRLFLVDENLECEMVSGKSKIFSYVFGLIADEQIAGERRIDY